MTRLLAPFFAILALVASAGLLSGCNTVAGAGQDVSATGHAVSHTADDVKQKL